MTPDPTAKLLQDLISRDVQRVWAAAHPVIRLPAHERLLLVPSLAALQRATEDLDLGGSFFSNNEHLRQAVRALEAARDGRCSCTLSPGTCSLSRTASRRLVLSKFWRLLRPTGG
ncbi:hypothetical protein ACFFLM_02500 [Deinococcus oregonensis]|uniref:Uncharacterized protein n=1 Tax=Deinococcus oregonensis TaxID=1805970 RepID=A0ABV6ATL9_9DEIO